MGDVHFFDLPVYRLPEAKFYKLRDAQVDRWIYPENNIFSDRNRARDKASLDNLWEKQARLADIYGTWLFNEVTGHVRLFFCGIQVRGMHYAVDKKRVCKTDTKKFVWKTDKLVPEIDVKRPFGQTQILEAVNKYIRECKNELLPMYIDTSAFDNIANHMDWPAILAKASFRVRV